MAAPLPGTVELGGFAQWTWFDKNAGIEGVANPKDGLGYGGRLGVFLSDPRWEIEGDGYYSPQNNEFSGGVRPTDVNAHASAGRHLEVDRSAPVVGRLTSFYRRILI